MFRVNKLHFLNHATRTELGTMHSCFAGIDSCVQRSVLALMLTNDPRCYGTDVVAGDVPIIF